MSDISAPSQSSKITSRIALPAQDEDIVALRRALIAKLTYAVGKDPTAANERDRMVDRWMPSTLQTYAENRKRVYYLSLEFLIGKLLMDSLSNLGLTDSMRA